MGLDLQPDGLTAGLAEHCQLEKKNLLTQRNRNDLYVYFKGYKKRHSVKKYDR